MDKKDRKMEEQDHPLKNTDHAFVKVGKQGEPVIPETAKQDNKSQENKDKITNLDKR